MNLTYWLEGDDIKSRPAREDELSQARAGAEKKLERAEYAMRSCWNCNVSHARFLEDRTDGFLFACFECGHWYFNGVDVTVGDTMPPDADEDSSPRNPKIDANQNGT